MREVREMALRCLRPGAHLRTDRGAALYVTDDLSAEGALVKAGFACQRRGGLLAIGVGEALLPRIANLLPPPDPGDLLLARLSRHGAPARAGELALVGEALKESEPGGARRPDFEKRLRQMAALNLREGAGGGALALARRIHTEKEEPI